MKVIGIIPARYSSTRLPGKPLKNICGKPMIQHVYENALKSKYLDTLIVATDDERIIKAVRGFGGVAQLTSSSHETGSDRIAEVAQKIECDVVVNIQGDEPLIKPEIIDEITQELLSDQDVVMSTGCYQIQEEEMFTNPNVVKVVCDINNDAMFMSRSMIPYPRNHDKLSVFEHIGIYVYRKDFLMKYITLADTPLCATESLEQLKVMENGYKIRVVKTKFDYDALSVDTQEDLDRVISIINNRK
jgi:3-deoxy-manno-octulosonate cytidylyltransferase (CMP-KDO synthetase)